ncbi:hypothetical protein N7451_003058 [Penicillium sp. IBT 35674x]|nr:hypothetical protein N7451_003058 [Penicillium sp. IBT 35674x]
MPAVQGTLSDPSQLALAAVRAELEQTSNRSGDIVVVGRRSYTVEADIELNPDESVGTGTRQALGTIGSAMVQLGNRLFGSVLVLQAGSGYLSHDPHG